MITSLHKLVPEIDPLAILSVGAGKSADAELTTAQLLGVTQSFVAALKLTHVLVIPLAGVAFFVSLFQPWIKYHDPHKPEPKESNEKQAT